jgi:hypothetical protein
MSFSEAVGVEFNARSGLAGESLPDQHDRLDGCWLSVWPPFAKWAKGV